MRPYDLAQVLLQKRITGHQNERDVAGDHMTGQSYPVHPRHACIGYDEVRAGDIQETQRLAAI
jgi:hypothetical protein